MLPFVHFPDCFQVHTEIVRGSSARGVSPSASAAPPAPGPLSYARVASSGSSPVVRPEPTLTLKDLQDLDGLVRQHSAVIEDGLVWTAVANSVLERLSAEFGKLQALLTADTMGSGGVRDPVLCSCEAVSSSPLPEASPSVEPFRCGSHVVWYQATSGEFAFLDSLSTRVLLESVGNCHSALPNTVTVPIVQVDTGPLPDGFRGKYPFFHTLAVRLVSNRLCFSLLIDTCCPCRCTLPCFCAKSTRWTLITRRPLHRPCSESLLSLLCLCACFMLLCTCHHSATLVKRRKHRKLTLQQAAAKKRGAASLSPPLKPKTYEEQYFAVMGGKPPVSNTFGLPTDDFVETLPMDGLLDAFPVLPANEKRSPVLTAAPAATAPTLKDARDKEDWSFAKVIHKGGYFPALASTTVASGGPMNAWKRSAPPPPRPLLPSRASSSAPAPEAPSIQLFATGSSRRRK